MTDIKIEGFEKFINIDEKYYGGSFEILDMFDSLDEFSKVLCSGYFAVTDILLYELDKYSKELGTKDTNDFTLEEYSKYLRNYINSEAFRTFGFVSVNSISNYLNNFSRKRRINLRSVFTRNLSSKSVFLNFVDDALKKDHPLILQMGKRDDTTFKKYQIITGRDDIYFYLSIDGKCEKKYIDDVYELTDIEMGLLYVEVII